MKENEELIERLRGETGADYGFCEKVLKKHNNDYEKAKIYIMTYNDKFFHRMYRNVASVFTGDRSFRLKINDETGETIFDIPLVIPIIVCIILPISSIIIAMFLMLIILLNCSMHIEMARGESRILASEENEAEEELEESLEISDAQYEFNKKGDSFVASKQNIKQTESDFLNIDKKEEQVENNSKIGVTIGNEPIITKTDDDYYLLTIK